MILPRRRKRDKFLPWLLLAADLAVIYLTLHATFWLRFESGHLRLPFGKPELEVYMNFFHMIAAVLVFFLRQHGLYKPSGFSTFSSETAKVVRSLFLGILVLMAVTFFFREVTFSRSFLLMAGLFLAWTISVERFLLGLVVMWVDRRRNSRRNVLVIGANEHAKRLLRFYEKNPRLSTRVSAFVDDRPGLSEFEGLPVVGKLSDLGELIKKDRQIHEVVLAEDGLTSEEILKIIYECEKEMVIFRWIADVFGLIASRMSLQNYGGVSLLSFRDSPLADWENRALKRLVDIFISAGALVALSPVFAVLAYLVKSDSPGPVFYRQRRIGQDGRRFTLLKFRTMPPNAENKTGAVWAQESDPRRTKIGAFLREHNLDELPQLWNVLKGEMSLVGPRPERPFFVKQFKEDIPRYMARHSTRSGLTGWAQVNGLRGNTSIEERTKLDLYYIENWSLLLDFRILFMTLFAKNNAY